MPKTLEFLTLLIPIPIKALWLDTHMPMYAPQFLRYSPRCLHQSQNCLPHHDLEVKVFVAIYTWLATLCDNAEQLDMVPEVELFQQRYLSGENQPTVR